MRFKFSNIKIVGVFKSVDKVWFVLFLIGFLLAAPVSGIRAQSTNLRHEQASELTTLILSYGRDRQALIDFYSPRTGNLYGRPISNHNSPKLRTRLMELIQEYNQYLNQLSFEQLSINGQVDYTLLKRNLNAHAEALSEEAAFYKEVSEQLLFLAPVYQFHSERLRGTQLDAEQVAKEIDTLIQQLSDRLENASELPEMDMRYAKFGEKEIKNVQSCLNNVYDFYNGYDPLFSWWVPTPYKKLDSLLTEFADVFISKGKIVTNQKSDESGILGSPIGREKLIAQLKAEMIPYSPEELIQIANKEFAWCEEELLKASAEMGFGNDWKKAQEQVKNSFVPMGKQPELILKLYNDAKSFIKSRDLITWPEIADETWGMIMMSPERQLVNPFFTGGREISISYPTSSMAHSDKLMSMRGNNPYFSRGTVQHELIPGHHLQYYMNSRYKTYRSAFNTPFNSEGWALYWELLLYDMDFAQTPEERIGMLFWRMHRCARIIFSLEYHLGNWSPQTCIDFLVDRVGHELANAEGEVRRSFEGNYSPLYQVAYLIGGMQIMSLKKELVDSGKMSYKSFHDAFMKENTLPIEMMRAILSQTPIKKDFETSWRFIQEN